MDRGVVVGGVLICASFLLALALNRSADAPIPPVPSEEPAAIQTPCAEEVPRAASKHPAQRSDTDSTGASAVDASCG